MRALGHRTFVHKPFSQSRRAIPSYAQYGLVFTLRIRVIYRLRFIQERIQEFGELLEIISSPQATSDALGRTIALFTHGDFKPTNGTKYLVTEDQGTGGKEQKGKEHTPQVVNAKGQELLQNQREEEHSHGVFHQGGIRQEGDPEKQDDGHECVQE